MYLAVLFAQSVLVVAEVVVCSCCEHCCYTAAIRAATYDMHVPCFLLYVESKHVPQVHVQIFLLLQVDALVDHFMRFLKDDRALPVVWHQALLCFIQR